jgi:hypothetical protein
MSLLIAVLCESGSAWLHTDCGQLNPETEILLTKIEKRTWDITGGGTLIFQFSTKMEQTLK